MKKTIAILLVLVLAGVGLFAAYTVNDSTLTIGTVINGVNLMGIYEVGTAVPSGNTWGATAYTAPNTLITSSSITPVAVLHTKSNHRGGYKVTMKANSPLTSTSDPESSNATESTIGYVVSAFAGATNEGVSTATASAGATTATTIIDTTSSMSGMTTTSRDIKVTVADYDTAYAGNYTSTITFNYTAT